MAKYLTQEWLDQGRELAKDQPERAGASAKMQYVVTGGPDGDVKYYWVLENGKLLESQLGEIADADFTMTSSWDDSVAIAQGRARRERGVHAGEDEGRREHGQADAAAPAHEVARVQGAAGESSASMTEF